ncbi:hypothetical protein HK097_006981 [Rhizophlyctis rosea]|uniref:Enoyl reductase (ER) domain-containing protein n=1 Tax=Rhizophlyctis rosea TaxID=64517 RepID=A0AAD5SK47_9FUNG|nr:hypothetical protein HK097_006981 [Rhizophlyctis rosea]
MPVAARIHKFGDPSTIKIDDVPKPTAGPGQVVVHVRLRPVNPSDYLSISGEYPGFTPKEFPAVPGLEGYGVIDTIGEGVTSVQPGQRVVPFFLNAKNGDGSWQEYVVLPEQAVMPIPDFVTDEAAAQLIVNPLAVLGMLKELNAPEGSYIAQNAAGSVLGRLLIQIASHRNLKTVNVVRRAVQVPELKALGADIVVSTEGKTIEQVSVEIKDALTDAEIHGAIDAVAGEGTELSTKIVKDGGKVLLYGVLEGLKASISASDLLFRNLTVKGFWLSTLLATLSQEELGGFIGEYIGLLAQGVVRPFSGEVFDLKDAFKAVQKSVEVGRGGKVFLRS